jgi:hypothetical protein
MDGLLRRFTGRDRPSETAGAANLRKMGGQLFKGRPGDRWQPAQMVAAPLLD